VDAINQNAIIAPEGTFRVGTEVERLKPFRFPMLNLCRNLRQRLAHVTNAATNEGGIIFVLLGAPKRNGGDITVTRPNEWISHHIEVADPESVDIMRLEDILAQCLLNNWLAVAQRNAGKPVHEEIPLWFAQGLASLADSVWREVCFEWVEELMMAGRLRPVAELLEDGGLGEVGEPGVSTMLASWLVETRRDGYARLSGALVNGATWSGTALLEHWLEMTPPAAQESWDLWLHQCRYKIFNAGTAEVGVWERLRHLLYVYGVDAAMPVGDVQRGKTFAELIDMPPSSWRARAAAQRNMALRASVLGRDNTYREVVEAYCAFLEALQKNEPADKLRARLSIAEARYLAAYAEVKGLNKEPPKEQP